MQDQNRADGDFGGQTLRRTVITWLDTHPAINAEP